MITVLTPQWGEYTALSEIGLSITNDKRHSSSQSALFGIGIWNGLTWMWTRSRDSRWFCLYWNKVCLTELRAAVIASTQQGRLFSFFLQSIGDEYFFSWGNRFSLGNFTLLLWTIWRQLAFLNMFCLKLYILRSFLLLLPIWKVAFGINFYCFCLCLPSAQGIWNWLQSVIFTSTHDQWSTAH